MKISPKIHYDPKVKILSIRIRKQKSVDSDIHGNVVLDYDKEGNLVNIDVMDMNLEKLMKSAFRERLKRN